MELGDTNLLDKLFYSCETKPYLISAYIGNNPVRFPYRVYIGRTPLAETNEVTQNKPHRIFGASHTGETIDIKE